MLDLVEVANLVKLIAISLATIFVAYAGFQLATSKDVQNREEWKEVIAGVFIGIALLFLAPILANQFIGASYCIAN